MLEDVTPLEPPNRPASAAQPRSGATPVHARYLAILAVPCLIVAIYLGLATFILDRNRENIGPAEAAEIQAGSGGLYGSALFYRPALYKLALYEHSAADVVVFGSSRSMEFRAEGFSVPIVNMGGNAATIDEASTVIDRMLKVRRPKVVLLTIDYWWFSSVRSDEAGHSNSLGATSFTLQQLLMPITWLSEGSARPKRLVMPPRTAADGGPLIGIFANQTGTGFDRDGAYHYAGLLTGAEKPEDVRFKKTLRRLTHAKDSKIAINAPFSEEMWRKFQDLTRNLHDNGVTLILVIPPVAPPVYAAMQQMPPPLLNETVRQRLTDAGETVFDFHNPASLGSDACEFLDGYHPGEVAVLRMLRAIRTHYADRPDIAAVFKPEAELSGLIDANAGHAALAGAPVQGKEIDFLKLGCAK